MTDYKKAGMTNSFRPFIFPKYRFTNQIRCIYTSKDSIYLSIISIFALK